MLGAFNIVAALALPGAWPRLIDIGIITGVVLYPLRVHLRAATQP
ncbi:hypothetical protein [Streptomyces cadmiisoli]